MKTAAKGLSLFQVDSELEDIIEEIDNLDVKNEEVPEDLLHRFQAFCRAYEEKAYRVGHFVRMMEFREQYCRQEAARFLDRARLAEGRVKRTESMMMYLLMRRGLSKLEGQ